VLCVLIRLGSLLCDQQTRLQTAQLYRDLHLQTEVCSGLAWRCLELECWYCTGLTRPALTLTVSVASLVKGLTLRREARLMGYLFCIQLTRPVLSLTVRVASVVTGLTLWRKTQLISGRHVSVTAFITVKYSTSLTCSVQS
jgi:hypothetical protein